MNMLRSSVILSALVLALSACGDTGTSDSSRTATAEEAMQVAATPFSIGDTTENEMGSPPPNELDDGMADPYERMARSESVAAPEKPEMAQ